MAAMMLVDPWVVHVPPPISPPQDAEARPWANGDHHLSQVRSRWLTAPRGSPSKPVPVAETSKGGWKCVKGLKSYFWFKTKGKQKWNAPKASFTMKKSGWPNFKKVDSFWFYRMVTPQFACGDRQSASGGIPLGEPLPASGSLGSWPTNFSRNCTAKR